MKGYLLYKLNRIIKKTQYKITKYWFCQLIGWSLFGFSSIIMTTLVTGTIHAANIYATIYGVLTFLIISHIGRNYLIRYDVFSKSFKRILLSLLSFVLIASFVGVFIVFTLMILTTQVNTSNVINSFYISFINALFTFAAWASFYAVYKIFKIYEKNEIKKLKLENESLENELRALIHQINPHFMFNSLNNIRGLILEDPEKARCAITRLSNLLRVALKFDQERLIEISSELNVVKEYIELEELTHGESLSVDWDINIDRDISLVPAFCIQTIVENAIKHGRHDSSGVKWIHIQVYEQDDWVNIEVKNTGEVIYQKGETNGIGIQNLNRRFELHDIEYLFELNQATPQIVKAKLNLRKYECNNSRRFHSGKKRAEEVTATV
jgi:two-component system, LytTR family, sensor kinase